MGFFTWVEVQLDKDKEGEELHSLFLLAGELRIHERQLKTQEGLVKMHNGS
jgi:TolB-like protein